MHEEDSMRPHAVSRITTLVSLIVAAGVALSGCTGRDPEIVPDVTGLTLSDATIVLEGNNLKINRESQLWHENYDVIPVISTDPAAGDPVDWPFEVTLSLADVTVTNVVDGDTLDLSTGDRVRLIGLDAPETGECGAAEATTFLAEMVAGRTIGVENPIEIDDRDGHGRLLAYIRIPGYVNDVGYQLLINGLAEPRYNSTDGYGTHPTEEVYAEGAKKATPLACGTEVESQLAGQPGNSADSGGPANDLPHPSWVCSYSPTYDNDWHNDIVCSNGDEAHRPYLREWDSFVTEDEIMESAREYERQLNGE